MKLEQALKLIKPVDYNIIKQSQEKWDKIAKPLQSLGALETTVTKMAAIAGTADFDIDKRCVVIMCADHGVVAQGVTQADSIVTTIMAENFAKGTTTVCVMAKSIGVDVIPVDIGINSNISATGLINKKIMYGSNDISLGPAMTRLQAVQAIEVGIEIALSLKDKGYKLIATGEMGIGNTTPSAAIASVLFGREVNTVCGSGAGLDKEGFERKINAVKRAIEINKPDREDPIDVIGKVGGLDIAGMVGLFLGGAAVSLPVMVDGLISGIAAVLASRICPACKEYMIATHMSAEPAGKLVLKKLDFMPIITAGMRLGEGTGAMAALTVIDMAVEVYKKTITFPEIDMEKYIHFKN